MFVNKTEQPKTLFRVATFDELAADQGLSSENSRARAIGVDHASLWRIRRGRQRVSEQFISRTLTWARRLDRTPEIKFEDLFEVVCGEPAA